MKLVIVFLALIFIFWAFVLPVKAANLNGDQNTIVVQKIKTGALLLQAPADVVLPEVFVSSEAQTSSTVASDFLVEDNRGNNPPVGWSATVTMTKLVSSSNGSEIPFVDPLTGNDNYRLIPQNMVAYKQASTEGVSLGAAEELQAAGNGISLPKTVMVASPGYGEGRLGCDIKIEITIPAGSHAADDYTSTMTFTVS
ncbi:MAG TPA: hypothetical protein VMW25_00975 [Clostridia bacterium]|nr:hypothetical protein [Clostridia bacterium]